jgi:CubicO group peptidase (beta-lactamase class C family)
MDKEVVLQKISDPDFKQICETVVSAMEELHVPGVAVGVLHGDTEHVAGLGVTHVDHSLPVTADTLFQVGSITKTFTGTAVMRLVEMGKLDLDVPIRSYLPDLSLADEATTRGVTLRHVLTHTGGWAGDYFDDTGDGDEALAKIVADLVNLP